MKNSLTLISDLKSQCESENIKDKNLIDNIKYCFPLTNFQEDRRQSKIYNIGLNPPLWKFPHFFSSHSYIEYL